MSDKPNSVQSPLLNGAGITHGWFTRDGGVSDGLFKSLNGKRGSGDSDANVTENRRRAADSLCIESMHIGHITHAFKNRIKNVEHSGEFTGYDASLTAKKRVVLSQTTADCANIIIASSDGTVVGMVHGSWHTLKQNIICDTIAKIKLLSSADLIAGIGPMICGSCYEFGPEAAELFEPQYITPKNSKFLVDLKQMAIDQLQDSGIAQIDDLNICTLEDNRFFSHRRAGPHSGRMITLASLTDVI